MIFHRQYPAKLKNVKKYNVRKTCFPISIISLRASRDCCSRLSNKFCILKTDPSSQTKTQQIYGKKKKRNLEFSHHPNAHVWWVSFPRNSSLCVAKHHWLALNSTLTLLLLFSSLSTAQITTFRSHSQGKMRPHLELSSLRGTTP